jgi:thiol-disulfide isomerase/thioredoxin
LSLISATRTAAAALLYAALAATANPAAALDPAALDALRTGEMRKLVVADSPMPAPDLGFTDLHGNPLSLADSGGKVRLVNFWATWCVPCRAEMPALDALERDLGGADFAVIPIATGRNSLDAIAAFSAEAGITDLPTYLDPKGELARAMAVPGLPVSVLLDRDGNEIARLTGAAEWDGRDARALVEALTAAEPAAAEP